MKLSTKLFINTSNYEMTKSNHKSYMNLRIKLINIIIYQKLDLNLQTKMKVTKLLVFIVCIFLLTELFIDDVEARNKGKNKRKRRKNKHKGCKGKPKTGRCARKKSKITTTTVATTTTTGSSLMTPVKVQREQHPNMRNRQQSLNQRSYFSSF